MADELEAWLMLVEMVILERRQGADGVAGFNKETMEQRSSSLRVVLCRDAYPRATPESLIPDVDVTGWTLRSCTTLHLR